MTIFRKKSRSLSSQYWCLSTQLEPLSRMTYSMLTFDLGNPVRYNKSLLPVISNPGRIPLECLRHSPATKVAFVIVKCSVGIRVSYKYIHEVNPKLRTESDEWTEVFHHVRSRSGGRLSVISQGFLGKLDSSGREMASCHRFGYMWIVCRIQWQPLSVAVIRKCMDKSIG